MRRSTLLLAALAGVLACSCDESEPDPTEVLDRPSSAGWLRYPCRMEEFLARAPEAQYGASHEWEVFLQDGGVMVRPYTTWSKAGTSPSFPLEDDWGLVYTHRVADGWLVGYNKGEFGASLWWYSEDGQAAYRISDDHVQAFVEAWGDVFVLQGLDHLSLRDGSIVRVRRNERTGKWVSEPFVVLHEAPYAGTLDQAGAMLVVTSTSMVRVTASAKMAMPLEGTSWSYPNSIVVAPDGTIFVGARGAVVEIRTLDGTLKPIAHVRTRYPMAAEGTSRVRSLPQLLEALTSPDAEIRREAAQSLGRLGPKAVDAVPALTRALEDPEGLVRLNAASTLGAIGEAARPAVPALIRAVSDTDWSVRMFAREALAEVDPEEAIAFFVRILESEDDTLREEAASALGEMGPAAQAAVPSVEIALEDEQTVVRVAAVWAVSRILRTVNPPKLAGLLVRAAEDPSADVREAAASVMADLAPTRPEVVAALTRLVRTDESADVRREAACALGQTGPASEGAIATLLNALRDDAVAGVAAQNLGEMQPPPVAALVRALKHADPAVRAGAADALRQTHGQVADATPALIQALDDEEARVRAEAAAALGNCGGPAEAIIPALVRTVEQDPDSRTRRAAVFSLGDVGSASSRAAAALVQACCDADEEVRRCALICLADLEVPPEVVVPVYLAALSDSCSDTALRAARALGRLGPQAAAAVPALTDALTAGPGSVQRVAARALGRIGPSAESAVPALVRALRGPDAELRLVAAEALGQIGPGAADAVPSLERATKSRDLRLVLRAARALDQIRP